MRLSTVLLLSTLGLAPACKTTVTGEGGLTREQCGDVVRKQNKILTRDTGGLDVAMQSKERSSIEQCMARGTPQAYRCVMQAQTESDLQTCELSMH